MGEDPTLIDGLFGSGYAFKDGDSLIESLKGFNVYEVCSRSTVLGDQDWFVIMLKISDDLRGFAFEGSHEFSSHEVIL